MSLPAVAYISEVNEVPAPIADHLPTGLRHLPAKDHGEITESLVIAEYIAVQKYESKTTPLLESLVHAGKFVLVVPPTDDESEIPLTASTQVNMQTDETSIHVRISPPLAESDSFAEFSVETIGFFSRTFGQVIGTDENEEPVCTLWQPSSISGGAVITTINLAELAISGNEQHRRNLLTKLIEFLNTLDSKAPKHDYSGTSRSDSSSIPSKTLDKVLLGIYLQYLDGEPISPTQDRINRKLPPTFEIELSGQEWNDILDVLEDRDIWTNSRIMTDQLEEAISNRNLASFARRLNNA